MCLVTTVDRFSSIFMNGILFNNKIRQLFKQREKRKETQSIRRRLPKSARFVQQIIKRLGTLRGTRSLPRPPFKNTDVVMHYHFTALQLVQSMSTYHNISQQIIHVTKIT